MAERCGIAVAGSILVDQINEIAAYPGAGELTQIRNVQKAVGGCVPNVAIDIKRIDPTLTVKAVGRIGKDEEGSFVTDVLSENGVVTLGQTLNKGMRVCCLCGGNHFFLGGIGAPHTNVFANSCGA